MVPLYPWNMLVARGLGNGTSRPFVNPSNVDVHPARLQRRPPTVRRDATGHRRCDSAVAQGQRRDTQRQPDHAPCECCQTAPCRPASRPRARAQDGAPDDDQFQMRKAAAFSRGLWPGDCLGTCSYALGRARSDAGGRDGKDHDLRHPGLRLAVPHRARPPSIGRSARPE